MWILVVQKERQDKEAQAVTMRLECWEGFVGMMGAPNVFDFTFCTSWGNSSMLKNEGRREWPYVLSQAAAMS